MVIGGCGDGGSSSATKASGDSSSRASSTTGASTSTTTTTTAPAAAVSTVGRIPEETGGPYPGDGSNGPNVLTQDGVVRSDIRSSFGSSSTVASGVPLTIDLTLVDVDNGGVPLEGAAVYLWHCDIGGGYSMYSQGVSGENYLRGVQAADRNGKLTFTSIFPAAYSGRWPHIHFQVYEDVAAATGGGTKLVTSQLAIPEDVCDVVYATDGYSTSVSNLARTSLATDNVFSDGVDLQLASVAGSPSAGYVASLTVGV